MADGSRHNLFAVKEDDYGVTPANPALDLVRITGTTLGLSKDSLESQEIRSDRQRSDFRLGANQVGGDINFELSYGSFDQLLQAAFVSPDWAAGGGGEQIKGAQERSSFTFVRNFSDLDVADNPYYIYTGVEINQLQLNITANQMITGTFSVIGSAQTTAPDLSGMGTPTFPPESTTSPLDAFTGVLKEGGVVNAVITEISLTLQNGIEPRFVVGNKNSIEPSIGRSIVSGQATAYFEDSVMVDKFLNETESDIELEMPDGAGNKQVLLIPRIKYTSGQPDVTSEGPILLNMSFEAVLDAAEGTSLVLTRIPV